DRISELDNFFITISSIFSIYVYSISQDKIKKSNNLIATRTILRGTTLIAMTLFDHSLPLKCKLTLYMRHAFAYKSIREHQLLFVRTSHRSYVAVNKGNH